MQPHWREALDLVVERDLAYFGHRLVSVLLRGSVADGTAIDGLSDLDTAVIVERSHPDDDRYTAELEREVMNTFPFCRGVESPVLSRAELLHSPLNEGWDARAFYRLLARTVWGEDVLAALPEVQVGRSTAFESPFVLLVVEEARRSLHDGPGTCAATSTWMFKSLVRAGFEIVGPRIGAFTRELRACVAAFGREYPEYAALIQRAAAAAVDPQVDPGRSLATATDLAPLLVDEAKLHLGIDQITDRRYLARLK